MLKKFAGNILIYGGTNAIRSLVPLFMLPILTTYLSPKNYGVLSLIEVSILFLVPFISLNINSAINVEYFKLSQNKLKKYISNALLVSLLVSLLSLVLLFLLREPISQILNVEISLIVWLPIFAFLRVVSSVILGIYQVSDQVIKFAFYSIAQTVIDFALSFALVVFYHNGYIGRLEGIYGAFLIVGIFGMFSLSRMNYLDHRFVFSYTQKIFQYGAPLIPHVLGGIILAMSDRYFISYFVGNDMVGYYTVAYQMAALMLLVSVSVNQAWMPMMYRFLTNYSQNKNSISQYTFYLFIFYTLCAIGIYLFRDTLFFIFVDEKFDSAKIFFPILLLGFLFQSYYYLYTNYLFFYKKTVLLAKITFFSAILNIILNYIFIIKYGAIGVAYATSVTYGVYCMIVYWQVRKLQIELLSK